MAGPNDKKPDNDRTQVSQKTVADPPPAAQPETVILSGDASIVPPAPRPDAEDEFGPETNDVNILPGTMINNNYEIKELISAGGMGEVFRGENAFTGDTVAIKIVLNSLANDEKVAALFIREAKVLCQLSDQAIVRYYNFVKDTNLDRFCLIMEFIEGVSLSDEMREKGPLSVEQTKNLMRRLAAGLGRAHEMEVVHRDLSPDNVILRDGEIENAVLIDFGIAKSATNVESTLHGQLAGKFKYISPEQLGHYNGEVGPRTDVYGLGLLMAAAVRGKPLDMGTTVVEAVNARQSVPDLSDVDPEIRPLLTHMLQPDPANRPARMSDLIALIDGPVSDIVTGFPTQTTPPRPVPTLVPGLRQPPGRGATTLSGSLESTGVPESATPFGVDPVTTSPVTMAPTAQPVAPVKSRSGLYLFILAVLLAAGGYVIATQDVFAPEVAVTEPDTPTIAPSGPDISTREGFLAARSTDPCVFATRIPSGPNSGVISALATDTSQFDGLADAYDEAFNARPSVLTQTVTAEQCPALDLAHAIRAQGGPAVVLTLDNTDMVSGGSIVGQVSDRRGRTVWLALVSSVGLVYNLTDRLTEQANGSATFTFALQAEDGSDPTTQVLIAIASDSPLIAAAAATDGTSADVLLPLIQSEIAGRETNQSGASIGVFSLSP